MLVTKAMQQTADLRLLLIVDFVIAVDTCSIVTKVVIVRMLELTF